jgi:1,4-alpha-glucan branching enzyme
MKDFMYRYHEGTEHNAHHVFGGRCHREGAFFRVYAPNAKNVSVVGNFNEWNSNANNMDKTDGGMWELSIPHLMEGQLYKFAVCDQKNQTVFKSDPYAYRAELRPNTASILYSHHYHWHDEEWVRRRAKQSAKQLPMNVYEVHLSSWKSACTDTSGINMHDIGEKLVTYCKNMHYTHVEIMPVMEYPLDASWGYHVTGYFALSARYGKPEDLKYFIEQCHLNDIGVILDWVPGHFCPDEHGLMRFDGTHLYGGEVHPHWGSVNFDFSTKHVWSFLLSSACFWADYYHIDGIRVDGVSSMLDLNYGFDHANKKNEFGGTTNLHAKDFLCQFNAIMHQRFKGFLTYAEEATDFPKITHSIESNGLGFDYKWNMGWMNDTLAYYQRPFEERKARHYDLTFSSVYAQSEAFILPFSHDEVVHGKKQLIDKMPGTYWESFAGLRAMMGYQVFHPGKKLNFMGNDIAQKMEWRYYQPIEFFMLDYPIHGSFHNYMRALNQLYRNEPALYELDHDVLGFEWVDANNVDQSVYIFLRRARSGENLIIVINNSPQLYENFRMGVPQFGEYREIFSSNLDIYDGSGIHNEGHMKAEDISWHQKEWSIVCVVPPLSATVIKKIV